MKVLQKNIKPFILLAAVLCSTFASLFATVNNSYAVTDPATLYLAPEVVADATASAYRTSMALCLTYSSYNLTGGSGDTISAQDAANGKWFSDNTIRPGYLVDSNANHDINCSDFFKYPVAQSLGFPDNISLACGVGLVRTDGQNCLTDPQQSDFTDKNINGDRNKVYAGIDANRQNASAPPAGGWNNAQMYVMLMKTFTEYCQATPVTDANGPGATPVIKAKYAKDIYQVVDGTGNVTPVYYNIPDRGKGFNVMNKNDGSFSYWNDQCDGIQGDINNDAPAYAAYVQKHNQPTTPPGGSNGGTSSGPTTTPDKTSCSINGIGWIVCPVMRFMAQVTDYAYGIVADMLKTPALDTSTTSPMYQSWAVMRNFANVAFVIAFLLIIYAQITGVGITNYGIKKLLPRIIVAAILVNVSYWICAIAIDLSNILGSSLSGLLEGIAKEPQLFQSGKSFASSGGGGGWDILTVGIIVGVAAGAALYAGLSMLIPMLLAALVAIITVVIVLTARQALIVLLTVISPLAFVAYLLPNTEKLFHKWREVYQDLLLLFPIIAIIFGASKLASVIVMNAPGANTLTQIMAAGITIIPLAITPIIMKTTKGVLGKIGAYVNNPNRGPIDRMRKGAAGYRQNRQEYRKLKELNPEGRRVLPGRSMFARRKAQREAVLTNRKSELHEATADYISGLATDNPKFRKRLAQGGIEGADGRALAQALNIQAKLKADEVTASHAVIKHANLEGDIGKLQELGLTGQTTYTTTAADGSTVTHTLSAPLGSALQTAAIQQQFKIGDVKMTDQLVMQSGSMGVDQRQAIAEGMQAMSSKVAYYKGNAANEVAQGNIKSETDLNRLAANTVNDGRWSADVAASADKDALARVANVLADPVGTTIQKDAAGNTVADSDIKIDNGQLDKLKASIEEIKTSPSIKSPDARTWERLNAIHDGTPYPPPTSP